MDKLALIELLDRDGTVRATHSVWRWPVVIGRAIESDLVLDDPYVAPRHAVLVQGDDGTLRLRVAESRNGLSFEGRQLAEGDEAALASGGTLALGHTRLRLRLAGEALAPERPLASERASPVRGVVLLALAALAWTALQRWVDLDPGTRWSDWVPFLLGAPVGAVAWAGLWGLGSKLFQHRFEFAVHLRLVLVFFLLVGVADVVLRGASFVTGWAWPSHIAPIVQAGLLCALIHLQLSAVLPNLRRVLGIAIAALFVAGQGVLLALNHQRSDRWFDDLYIATLGPPVLRLAPTVEPKVFFDEARALRERLDRKAQDDAEDEAEP